jgi:hypothetical protein
MTAVPLVLGSSVSPRLIFRARGVTGRFSASALAGLARQIRHHEAARSACADQGTARVDAQGYSPSDVTGAARPLQARR